MILRNILVLGLLSFAVPLAVAQAPPAPSIVFLSSSPINAQVMHNGAPLAVETPLLLRDLAPGKHTFELRKQGYPARTGEHRAGGGGGEGPDRWT